MSAKNQIAQSDLIDQKRVTETPKVPEYTETQQELRM